MNNLEYNFLEILSNQLENIIIIYTLDSFHIDRLNDLIYTCSMYDIKFDKFLNLLSLTMNKNNLNDNLLKLKAIVKRYNNDLPVYDLFN